MQQCVTHLLMAATQRNDAQQVETSTLPEEVEAAATMDTDGHLVVLIAHDAVSQLCPLHAAALSGEG